MGGTALAAGLVTRGICGSSEPTASGGATKSQLYINYDGNNVNNPAERGLVLNAGSVGANLGNGVYQYTAVRGDALCAYVQAKGYATQANMTVLSGAISSKIHLNVSSQSVNKDLSALVINKLTQAEYDALAVKNSDQLYIVESDGSSDQLNANSKTVVNVAAPVNATDAANKDYVDNRSIVIFGGNASTCG